MPSHRNTWEPASSTAAACAIASAQVMRRAGALMGGQASACFWEHPATGSYTGGQGKSAGLRLLEEGRVSPGVSARLAAGVASKWPVSRLWMCRTGSSRLWDRSSGAPRRMLCSSAFSSAWPMTVPSIGPLCSWYSTYRFTRSPDNSRPPCHHSVGRSMGACPGIYP